VTDLRIGIERRQHNFETPDELRKKAGLKPV
jgi:hypothetical protein